jgi:hypothetical protein
VIKAEGLLRCGASDLEIRETLRGVLDAGLPAEWALRAGRVYLALASFDEARACAVAVTRERPDDADALHLLGAVAGARGDRDDNVAYWLRVLHLDASEPARSWSPTPTAFMSEVKRAQARLPAALAALLEGASIVRHDRPDAALIEGGEDPRAGGVCVGRPPGAQGEALAEIERFLLFQGNIERVCRGPESVSGAIRATLEDELLSFSDAYLGLTPS